MLLLLAVLCRSSIVSLLQLCCYCVAVLLLLYHDCVLTVSLFCCSCVAFYCSCVAVVLLLCHCRAFTVLRFCCSCVVIVLLLCHRSAATVSLLSSHCVAVVYRTVTARVPICRLNSMHWYEKRKISYTKSITMVTSARMRHYLSSPLNISGMTNFCVVFFAVDQPHNLHETEGLFPRGATPLLGIPWTLYKAAQVISREKSLGILHHGRELNSGHRENRRWAIPLSYYDQRQLLICKLHL